MEFTAHSETSLSEYNCNNVSTCADFGSLHSAYADEAEREGFIETRNQQHQCDCPRHGFLPFFCSITLTVLQPGNTQQDPVSHFLHFIVSCITASTRKIQRILQLALLAGDKGCAQHLAGSRNSAKDRCFSIRLEWTLFTSSSPILVFVLRVVTHAVTSSGKAYRLASPGFLSRHGGCLPPWT